MGSRPAHCLHCALWPPPACPVPPGLLPARFALAGLGGASLPFPRCVPSDPPPLSLFPRSVFLPPANYVPLDLRYACTVSILLPLPGWRALALSALWPFASSLLCLLSPFMLTHVVVTSSGLIPN